jgi:hypothetical protein
MRARLAVLLLFACNGSGSQPPPGATDGAVPIDGNVVGMGDAATLPPDGSTTPPDGMISTPPDAMVPIDGGDGCATAPTGDWAGTMRFYAAGAGSFERFDADVTWTLASTAGCVDHYTPSGTFAVTTDGCCCTPVYDPASGPIEASDGELVIDRSTAPATFRVVASSEYASTEYPGDCGGGGDPIPTTRGGQWADDEGVVSGDVIDGAVHVRWSSPYDFSWHLRRAGASFPPPTGCAEPATETWQFTGHALAAADLTWTRADTSGCVDTFQPSGTVHVTQPPSCTTWSADPPSAPVASTDGTLTVDRSTNPPTYDVQGITDWQATVTCTHPDGTTETTTGFVGGPWASSAGAYGSNVTGGGASTGGSEPDVIWTLRR